MPRIAPLWRKGSSVFCAGPSSGNANLYECFMTHYAATGIRSWLLESITRPTGRTEALNNNWETLVRRARGYRDHSDLLLKLRFMTANPIRTKDGARRFLALDLPAPLRHAA
jgi:hypothetical protein